MIRNLRRVRYSLRFWLAQSSAEVYLRLVLLIFFFAGTSQATSPPQSQDSDSKPAPAPAQSKPSTATSPEATPLKKAVHEKKIITEDDLAKPAKPLSFRDAEEEENDPLCDSSCEAELKAQMGFTPEREFEFRNQLTFARHEISSDKAWNSMLDSALRAAGLYCDLQRQKAQIVAKGTVSQVTLNEIHARYYEREQNLSSQYRNFEGQVTQRIAAVQRFAPFRAMVMQFEWSAAANHACPDFKLP